MAKVLKRLASPRPRCFQQLPRDRWRRPGRNGRGRVPDAPHTIECEETDASRTCPQPFLPQTSKAPGLAEAQLARREAEMPLEHRPRPHRAPGRT
eukprot:gene16850-biopygen20323